MRQRSPNIDFWGPSRKAPRIVQSSRVAISILVPMACILVLALQPQRVPAGDTVFRLVLTFTGRG